MLRSIGHRASHQLPGTPLLARKRGMALGIAVGIAVGAVFGGIAVPAHAADISTITHGARVQLESSLVEGKLTLFDFYADWCSGCRQIAPVINGLASAHSDALAVRKIDIVSWGSPVAGQFGLRSIPHLKLYDADGRLLREGDPNVVLPVLQQRLGGAPAAGGSGPLRSAGGTGGGLATFVLVAVAIIIGGIIVGSMRRRSAGTEPDSTPASGTYAEPDLGPGAAGGDPDALPIWFAMIQGSLEGPFSLHDLRDLERRGGIKHDDKVRRKGDSSWRQLRDLL